MSIKEVTAESLASLFFHYQSALAPDFGCASSASTEWQEMPTNERQRMIAAARLTLLDLADAGVTKSDPQSAASGKQDYIGEEGREWGC